MVQQIIVEKYVTSLQKKMIELRSSIKKNGGLSDARNVGLEYAKGDYLAFIDSDDRLHIQFIEDLYSICIRNDCQIAQGNGIAFIKDETIPTQLEEEKIDFYTGRNMCLNLFSNDYYGTGIVQNKIYTKELFSDGLRFPYGKQHEDEFTVYQLFWKAKKSRYRIENFIFIDRKEKVV